MRTVDRPCSRYRRLHWANVVERDGYSHCPPELVVEVLSEQAQKLRDYESLGVPEVWALSPEAQTVELLLFKHGRLVTTSLLR